MNVTQMIELLEDCDPEAEVWLAHQPSWPLQFTVRGVYDPAATPPECSEHGIAYVPAECGECDELTDTRHQVNGPVVYIVEGDHPNGSSPYAPKEAWEQVVTA